MSKGSGIGKLPYISIYMYRYTYNSAGLSFVLPNILYKPSCVSAKNSKSGAT